MLKEFKAFISKGNVLELAVGLIMATYFGAIVKSMVDDLIMPALGNLIGGIDFSSLKIVITEAKAAVINADGTEISAAVNEVAIRWGLFLNTILTFVIVAFSVFLVIKAYNKFQKKKDETPAPKEPTDDQKLLAEIRDILKSKS